MKYFLHDSNAFQDEKITELYMSFGYEGLGLFYTALEKLANQEKPIKTEVLKAQLKVGKKLNKCWNFMESLGILSSNNGETFNKQLLNFSEKYQIKKEKNANRLSEWRKNQAITENVTCYESVRNAPKDNISKVNRSKVSITPLPPKISVLENVLLKSEEIEKLKIEFSQDYDWALQELSKYKFSSGKKYKSDYHALIGWVKEKFEKKIQNQKENKPVSKIQQNIDITTRLLKENEIKHGKNNNGVGSDPGHPGA